MILASELRFRYGRQGVSSVDRAISVRSQQIAAARRFMNEAPEVVAMDRYITQITAEVCVCGRNRGEHDIAPDFTQPCKETGCLDFTFPKGQTA